MRKIFRQSNKRLILFKFKNTSTVCIKLYSFNLQAFKKQVTLFENIFSIITESSKIFLSLNRI